MTTEQYAQQLQIKTLTARNTYLSEALEEFTERDRNNIEMLSILRNENHSLRERILDLEACR